MTFLSSKELEELTHFKRRRAQREALQTMGIEHKVRPDGTVAVLKSHIEKEFDGYAEKEMNKRVEPNWNAI